MFTICVIANKVPMRKFEWNLNFMVTGIFYGLLVNGVRQSEKIRKEMFSLFASLTIVEGTYLFQLFVVQIIQVCVYHSVQNGSHWINLEKGNA